MGRERGTVRWWKDDKGYGRITDERGEVLFCHFMFIEMDGFKSLREGDAVEFERVLSPGPHGSRWEAHHVVRLEGPGRGA